MRRIRDRLRQAWESGDVLTLGADPSGGVSGGVPDASGELPHVQGEWLLELLSQEGGHPRGLRLRNARVCGELDWSWHTLRAPLWLRSCLLDGDLDIGHVRAPGLALIGCLGDKIQAKEVAIEHSLVMNGSHITSLVADGARIRGNVFLCEGFSSVREISLLGVRVGNDLDLSGATLANPGGDCLSADTAQISGNVYLRKRFSSIGEIRLLGASIGGQLDLSGAILENPDRDSLSADRIKITGSAFLRDGFSSTGEIRLIGASIGGNLDLRRSTLSPGNGRRVLNLEGAHVSGCLWMQKATQQVEGVIDFTRTRVSELRDDSSFWPTKGSLILSGMVYDRLGENAPNDPEQRLDWIRRNRTYSPQPYSQVAHIFESTGQAAAARTIRIAARDDQRKLAVLFPHQRAWNHFMSLTIGHGYRPAHPARFLLPLYAVTVLLVWMAAAVGMFIPIGENVHHDPTTGRTAVTSSQCTADYPCLIPLAYAAESLIPVLDLHQVSLWQPDTTTVWGGALRIWLYVATGIGWICTSLILAALTGLTNHKE